MNNLLLAVLSAAMLVFSIMTQTMFVVSEKEKAVLLEWSKVVQHDMAPGLHFKIPVINEVRRFDGRILTVNSRPERFLTEEKKPMIVDSYIKWRVDNVGVYYRATNGDEARAEQLLAQLVNEGLRNQFSKRTLHEVISGERDQLMDELTKRLNEVTSAEYGIKVVDIRVVRIDLPEEVSDYVYRRMKSEREREARRHRSEGKEKAEFILANADREKVVLEADAFRQAEIIRGEGDAKAAAIYAQAYSVDPEFYAFQRSLQSYRQTFNNRGDVLLLDTSNEYFRYLKQPGGQ